MNFSIRAIRPDDNQRSPVMATLVEQGTLCFDSPDALCDDELAAECEFLLRFEESYRLQLPGPTPSVSPAAVRWAAGMFLRAAQFVAFRQLGEELLNQDLARPCPGKRDAATDYSVDLAFRFLPDLFRLTRAASESDPLLKVLERWAGDWPLSSVGMPIDPEAAPTTQYLMSDDTLKKVYADRILARQDRNHLRDDGVRTAVREWIGYYPEDAGGLRDVLNASS
jgi:hypothetical protein